MGEGEFVAFKDGTRLRFCPHCGCQPEYTPATDYGVPAYVACPAILRINGEEVSCQEHSSSPDGWNKRLGAA